MWLRLACSAVLAIAAACGGARATPRATPSLVSTAERSGWTQTGRYDEATTLCRDFARAYDHVTCADLGSTLQGRPIVALEIRRAPGKPTIYLQGGIHAGEIDGKDAGYWFLRDLLDGKVARGALDAVNIVFVPCINPDGHERFGPNNRPNQRGPVEMGFRTNSVRLNLNRDFMKADSVEIQAVLGLYRTHDPIVLVDLHATDGAKFEHDIAVIVAPGAPRADSLDETAGELSAQLQKRLTELGHLPLPFYPSFDVHDDPSSGITIGEAPPRFSQMYAAARSRIGILVETHSWRPYKERVASTYHLLQAVFERATADAARWQETADASSLADQRLGGSDLVLLHDSGPRVTTIDFRGYAYELRTSDISGTTWIVYDESKPAIWKMPLRDELVPRIIVRVPRAGYIVDGGYAALVAPVLDHHGIRHEAIAGQPTLAVDAYRATKVVFDPPYEGRTRVAPSGAWATERRTLDRGAIFIPIAQKRARLVVHLLDPDGLDSLARWGFFNTAFERKEYMEAYVAEQVARDQIAADPALRAAFDAAVTADAELANSPAKRLEWFYQRHPAWDERLNLLPIYRVDQRPR